MGRIRRGVIGCLWLWLGAGGMGQAHAETVLEWWRSASYNLTVVTPAPLSDLEWLRDGLNQSSIPLTQISPADATRSLPGKYVLFLTTLDTLKDWPASYLSRNVPFDPRSVAEDEVRIVNRFDHDQFQTQIIAPDNEQAAVALGKLMALARNTHGPKQVRVLASWKLPTAVCVGGNFDAAKGWLLQQSSGGTRYLAKPYSASAVRDRDLASPLVLLMLSHDDWSALDADGRQLLSKVLPRRVREVLDNPGTPAVATGVERRGPTTVVALAAPVPRFFAPLLCRTDDGRGVREPLPAELGTVPFVADLNARGGTMPLLDLRAFSRVAVLGVSRSRQMAEQAGGLADQLNQYLKPATGYEFVDKTALGESMKMESIETAFNTGQKVQFTGPDGLIIVQPTQVTGRTEYRRGQARRITPKPPEPKFDVGGFLKTLGDVLAKKEDAGKETREKNEARQREYENLLANGVYQWEVTKIETQAATVSGVISLYSRNGTALVSAPFAARVSSPPNAERQVVDAVGYESRPAAPPLPPNADTAPAELMGDAFRQAPASAAQSLLLRALFPSDGGQATPAAQQLVQGGGGVVATAGAEGGSRPAPAPTPTRAAANRSTPAPVAGPVQMVTVVGHAQFTGDVTAARRAAEADACRQALEKVVGVYVESQTLVDKMELVKDQIYTHTQGFAAVLNSREERQGEGEFTMTCDVQVSLRPLRDALKASGLLRQWRVLVVIPEECDGRAVTNLAAETELIRQLLAVGLPVLDKSVSDKLRSNRAMLASVAGDKNLANRLRTDYGAEILVTGLATSQQAEQLGGQVVCRARIDLRAIDLNTAEILAADAAQASGRDISAELAGHSAVGEASHQVADRFITAILARPAPSGGHARLEITVTGLDGFAAAAKFKRALAQVAGADPKQLEFKAGMLKVELQIAQGKVEGLPEQLEINPAMADLHLKVTNVTVGTIECTASK